MRRLAAAVWRTLHEPRAQSLCYAAAYAVFVSVAVGILASPPRTPIDLVVGCTAMIAGGAGAAASAWVGQWRTEAWCAGMVLLGLAAVTVEDAIRALSTDHWLGWPSGLAVVAALLLTGRVLAVARVEWEPGREPTTRLSQARTMVQAARVLEAEAVARSAESRQEAPCDPGSSRSS